MHPVTLFQLWHESSAEVTMRVVYCSSVLPRSADSHDTLWMCRSVHLPPIANVSYVHTVIMSA